jgi:hypothetical protein
MTIEEIYRKYRIHRGLQLHQLRVAAVGKYIAERSKRSLDSHGIVSACLLHDMGNIIKSDMTSLPELWQPEGVEYWSKVKEEVIQEYGTDEHAATLARARDIGVSDAVRRLVDGVGFSNLQKALETESSEQKICEYADVRVGPYGILSVQERLENWYIRYQERVAGKGVDAAAYYASLQEGFAELEQQLLGICDFKPSDITDESMVPIIAGLRNFQLV